MLQSGIQKSRLGLPDLGVGVGLRTPHYPTLWSEKPKVDCFEIISENFMVRGGMPLKNLQRVLEAYRVIQHGVSLSIGSTDPLNWEHLRGLRSLIQKTGSPWVSDHLCWSSISGKHLHDLFPLPYTEEAVRHVVSRARRVQDFLETRLVLENVSSYLTFQESSMPEWEFVSTVAEEADIGILLDVNNVYVSAFNHGFDPNDYIDGVPAERVVQIHLAGHTHYGTHIIDTHSTRVIEAVFGLYERACRRVGPVTTIVEWDDDIPAFSELLNEAEKARSIRDRVIREQGVETARALP